MLGTVDKGGLEGPITKDGSHIKMVKAMEIREVGGMVGKAVKARLDNHQDSKAIGMEDKAIRARHRGKQVPSGPVTVSQLRDLGHSSSKLRHSLQARQHSLQVQGT